MDSCETRAYITVREFYKDKSVLVTGATGFSGQALVEKLLRSCPEIGKIYIPIRNKRGVDAEQRYRKFLGNSVFNCLRATQPNFQEKLAPLYGNLKEPNLGLGDDQVHQLTSDLSAIFHVAALIKLNPTLSDAVLANVQLSTNVFRFGKRCKHLEAYIHVSTLFVQIDMKEMEEEVYSTKLDHDQLIELMRNDELEQHKKDIMGKSPGSYFATKKVGEYMTKLEKAWFPVAILRPGKISPSYREPLPGWSYGAASYIPWMRQTEKGEMHYFLGRPDVQNELIPVDLFANHMIVTAWYLGTDLSERQRGEDPLVVNLHPDENRSTMQDFGKLINPYIRDILSEEVKHLCKEVSLLRNVLQGVWTEYNTHHRMQISLEMDYFGLKHVNYVNLYLNEERRSSTVTLYPSRLQLFLRFALPSLLQLIRDKWKRQMPIDFYMFLVSLNRGSYMINTIHKLRTYKNLKCIETNLSESDKADFCVDFKQVDWKEYVLTWLRTIKNSREVKERESKIKVSSRL